MATAAEHAACGHEGHAHSHAHTEGHEDDLDELGLAFDPTLASCCERDEHEYKKAMKLKAVLTAHDRTSGAVRMRQQLFQPPPPGAAVLHPSVVALQVPPPRVSASDSEDSDDFDDSDDEFGVEAMLAARRKQFEQQLHKAAQDAAEGYGVVLDAALAQFVQELQNEPEVPRVALVVDSAAAESPGFLRAMRGEMSAVAQRFLGTKFYVVMATRDDDALRQLRLPSVPSLAAFRRGERVDSIALDPKALVTELEVLWEARFLPWLTKCSVLTSERQASQKARSKAGSRKAADEDETEREGFDCGVEGCRLRFGYEHEHVGTSQQTKDEIAAWRHDNFKNKEIQ